MTASLFGREPIQLDDQVWHLPDWLSEPEQVELIQACRTWGEGPAGRAQSRMPNGTLMSVETVCLGWYWYPYQYSRFLDDTTGEQVKRFPSHLGLLARRAMDATYGPDVGVSPDCAIVNRYVGGAKMGLHQDNEERVDAPVISISLGASCTFRFGNNQTRTKPWNDIVLQSGDLFVFGGSRRRSFHGVTKVHQDHQPWTAPGERFNITIRTVGPV